MTIKYLSEGQAVTVIKEIDGGAIISQVYDFEHYQDGMYEPESTFEQLEGRPYFVESKELFDKPPTEKKHEEVKRLDEEIEARRSTLNDMLSEQNAAQRQTTEYEQMLKHLASRFDLLKSLQAYFENKVTHVVEFDYHGIPQLIIAAGDRESRSGKDSRERKLRLISLTGELPYSKGVTNVGWDIHHYSDGSDSRSHPCIACTSHEEALRVGADACRRALNKRIDERYFLALAKACDTFGVEHTEKLKAFMEKHKASVDARNEEKTANRIKQLTDELARLEGSAA